MSYLLDPAELELLGQIADELREVFEERSHRVDVALSTDRSFGSGRSRSALTRDLAMHAVSGTASRIGLDFRPVNGDGRELRYLSRTLDRRYRVRRAHRHGDGSLQVTANSESALAGDAAESLFPTERWVFGWTLTGDGLIDDVFAAEVVGFIEGRPGRLDLGPAVALGSAGGFPSGGFSPSEEDLDGFDDEAGDDTGQEAG